MKLGPPVKGWRSGVRRGGVYYDGDAESAQEALIVVGATGVAEGRALGLEKMLLVNLDHPNVLRLHSLAVAPGKKRPVFAYAFVEGVGLGTALSAAAEAGGHLPIGVAASAVAQAAAAANAVCSVGAEMDGHGIWHHGPTPDDLLVDATGAVRAVGFQVWRQGERPERLTAWSSPGAELGAAGVVYGLGALLLVLLGGQPPGRSSDPDAAAHADALATRIEQVETLRGPAVSPLVDLARACLSFSPDQRPPLGMLAARLDELRLRAPPPGPILWAAQVVPRLLEGHKLDGDLVAPTWEEPSQSQPESASQPLAASAPASDTDHGDRPTELVGARTMGVFSLGPGAAPEEPDLAEASGGFSDHGVSQWVSGAHPEPRPVEPGIVEPGKVEPGRGEPAPVPRPSPPETLRDPVSAGSETLPDTLSSRGKAALLPTSSRMPMSTRVWMVVTSSLTVAVVLSLILRLTGVI